MHVLHAMRGVRRRLGAALAPLSALVLAAACTTTLEDTPNAPGATAGNGAGNGAGSAPAGTGGAFPGSGGSGSSGAPSASCAAPSPGPAPLRRLSNAEYRNTLNDLFSTVPDVANLVATSTREFPPESESLGFRNSAQFLTVQSLTAQKYMDAADAIATKAASAPGVVPCTPAAGQEMTCARTFIRDFGKRALRRPLTNEETARYETQFQTALTAYGFSAAVEWTIFSLLQSPAFLYRVERGQASAAAITRPTSYETASRLSYLFWQSLPDAALVQAAESGELDTPAKVETKARQMLSDPRSQRLFQYFAEWLDLDHLDDFSRDPQVFPGLPQDLPGLYRDESKAFIASLLSRSDGNFSELLTAPYTYANKTLAGFYGLSAVNDASFVRVDDARRSGVLTQAFLMSQDKPYRSSIVRRGVKLRTDLLCQIVPAPPNDVQLNLESIGPGLTQRERLEQHRKDPACAGCHALIDPIGLVFESFDAVGRYRTLDEVGDPIVTSSQIVGTRDANGTVADVRELGALLAASSDARDCYVTQTFRFFFGREVEAQDACSMTQLKARFAEKNFSLSELLVALTQTDAFLYRPTLEVSP